jgi:hypothetical protein
MCGHLLILIAKYASRRFQWPMAMIGLPTGESLLSLEKLALSESPLLPTAVVYLSMNKGVHILAGPRRF